MKYYAAVQYVRHVDALIRLFPFRTEDDPEKLMRKLRRLEARGRALGLRMCNGPVFKEHEAERIGDRIIEQTHKLLGNNAPIFLNTDPRGYALKIKDGFVRTTKKAQGLHMDLGGYGILCPDIK